MRRSRCATSCGCATPAAEASHGHGSPSPRRIRGRISWKQSLAYVGVQLLAAFLAALLVGSLLGYDHDHAKDSLAALGDSVFSDAYGSSVTEFFGTFILALVILLVLAIVTVLIRVIQGRRVM